MLGFLISLLTVVLAVVVFAALIFAHDFCVGYRRASRRRRAEQERKAEFDFVASCCSGTVCCRSRT